MTAADLLRVLGNKYSAEILAATDEPRSAQELSDDLGVPIATCYRRIDDLTDHDFLEPHAENRPPDRQQTKRYRRRIDGIRVRFSGQLTVDMESRDMVTSKIDDIWRQTGDAVG